MKQEILCDKCKRPFLCGEEYLTTYDGSPVAELVCPDCVEDLNDIF